jgi:hypothetical protein
MKFLDLVAASRGESGLVRAAAVTFIGATAMVALYFGREVLIPAAIAVLFAFILGPAVTWVRRVGRHWRWQRSCWAPLPSRACSPLLSRRSSPRSPAA